MVDRNSGTMNPNKPMPLRALHVKVTRPCCLHCQCKEELNWYGDLSSPYRTSVSQHSCQAARKHFPRQSIPVTKLQELNHRVSMYSHLGIQLVTNDRQWVETSSNKQKRNNDFQTIPIPKRMHLRYSKCQLCNLRQIKSQLVKFMEAKSMKRETQSWHQQRSKVSRRVPSASLENGERKKRPSRKAVKVRIKPSVERRETRNRTIRENITETKQNKRLFFGGIISRII